ncbi:cellular tumor antigen p53-like [Panthera leo]|uniref:cellular tumor antigen p53-like n=1 Tax=Panthera leo TaxID=9689 RepID=UPI001C69E84B|nr:cellular tumor antigen p53-like [Panthera leo]
MQAVHLHVFLVGEIGEDPGPEPPLAPETTQEEINMPAFQTGVSEERNILLPFPEALAQEPTPGPLPDRGPPLGAQRPVFAPGPTPASGGSSLPGPAAPGPTHSYASTASLPALSSASVDSGSSGRVWRTRALGAAWVASGQDDFPGHLQSLDLETPRWPPSS